MPRVEIKAAPPREYTVYDRVRCNIPNCDRHLTARGHTGTVTKVWDLPYKHVISVQWDDMTQDETVPIKSVTLLLNDDA